MKKLAMLLLVVVFLSAGCTKIVKMEPTSGPAGTPVYIKCSGMFGDPSSQSLRWDGKVIRSPFPGSFVIPAANAGAQPGRHKVTLVDDLDSSEAFLIFPIFRARRDSATFTVTP